MVTTAGQVNAPGHGNGSDSAAAVDTLIDCKIDELHYGRFKAVRDVAIKINNRPERGREYRDRAFLDFVDQIHAVITSILLPDERPTDKAKAAPRMEPLPPVTIGEIVGLVEVIHYQGDDINLFDLA